MTNLLLLSLITSIFLSNAFAADAKKYSISGVQLGMTPSEVIDVLKKKQFEVTKFSQADFFGRRISDRDDQEIKIRFSYVPGSGNKAIQIISKITILPISKPTKKDRADFVKELEQWSKDVAKDPSLPVPKIRTVNPTIIDAKKTYLSPHGTPLKESRINGESKQDSQLFKLNYFWSDLSNKCASIALSFFYYKLDNREDACPVLFAVSIQNKKNIATGREESLIVQKNIIDFPFLYREKEAYLRAVSYQKKIIQESTAKHKMETTIEDSGKTYDKKSRLAKNKSSIFNFKGSMEGKYSDPTGITTYDFKRNGAVTLTHSYTASTYNLKYKIDGDKLSIYGPTGKVDMVVLDGDTIKGPVGLILKRVK